MARSHAEVVCVLPTLVGGGAEHVVQMVAAEVAGSGRARVEVISLLDDPATSHTTSAGVEVLCLGAPRVRRALPMLLRHLRQRQPMVVVSTLKHLSMGLGLLWWALPRRTRHVARIANTYSRELPVGALRRAALRSLIALSHRRIDAFVCVSAGVRDDLVATFGIPRDRCTVIPNPVDVEDLRVRASAPAPSLPATVPAAEVRFLSVGRLEPQKDHRSLLQAFAALPDELDAVLLVAGDGSQRSALEAEVRALGIADRVVLLGFVPEPYPLFALSDVFVLSSRYEGMPNVLLEALALGLRCVSTDCPHGPAEILLRPELGLLVPVADVGALRDAMLAVARQPHDATLGRDHVRNLHGLARTAQAYADALLPGEGQGS